MVTSFLAGPDGGRPDLHRCRGRHADAATEVKRLIPVGALIAGAYEQEWQLLFGMRAFVDATIAGNKKRDVHGMSLF